MKYTAILCFVIFSTCTYAKVLTHNFSVIGLEYNKDKKYYETTFDLQAGVYKADEVFFKCLQKSLETKIAAKVTYEPMGLKITGCTNK